MDKYCADSDIRRITVDTRRILRVNPFGDAGAGIPQQGFDSITMQAMATASDGLRRHGARAP